MNLLKSKNAGPLFEKEEQDLLRRFLKYTILSAVLLVLALFPFTYTEIISTPLRIILVVFVLATNFAGWLLLRRGSLFPASALLVSAYWLLVFLLVFATGGLASPYLLTQVAVTVLGGLLLGGWAGILFALASIILDFLIYPVTQSGLFRSMLLDVGPLDHWISVVASFSIVALVIQIFNNLTQGAIRRARQDERRFKSLFDKTNDFIFLVGRDYKIITVNQQAADMLGYTINELEGMPYSMLVPMEEKENVKSNFDRLEKEEMTPLFERTLVRKDMSRTKVEINAALIRDRKGNPLYYQGVGRDLTDRKYLEEQLRYSLGEMETLAMQDPLTGLLNRRAIIEHAEAEWHRAQRDGKPMCLVLIDLDNLKVINDSEGHQMGDQVIAALGKVIESSKRRYDWAGRWGGDEFMLVLPGTNLPEAQEVAERLRKNHTDLALTQRLNNTALLSLGIACFSGRKGDETTLDKLIAQADQALYAAKEHGKNQIEVYINES